MTNERIALRKALVLLLLILFLTPLVGMLQVSSSGPGVVMYDVVSIGKGERTGDLYGSSFASGDLDGNGMTDLAVGAPGSDLGGPGSGAVYIFFDVALEQGLDASAAHVVIPGKAGNGLGSALTILEDVDGDRVNDLAIGASAASDGRGKVVVLSGAGIVTYKEALFEVRGAVRGGAFGSTLSSCGDIDHDGRSDILVGAPGIDEAYIVFGKGTPITHRPHLWSWDIYEDQPVTFTGGVNNTPFDRNTFGISHDANGSDDGWDWQKGTYGHVDVDAGGSGQAVEGAHIYAAPEPGGPDADGITADGSNRLEVQIGPSHIKPGPSGSPGGLYSGAWGIQVWIGQEGWASIVMGSSAILSFHWEAMDIDQSGSDDPTYVKARFGKGNDMSYLGEDLGGDPGPDVFYIDTAQMDPPWGPVNGIFTTDVTDLIDGPGWYYLDLGAVYDARTGNQRSNEGVRVYFDNVTFTMVGEAFHLFGPKGSAFGGSLLAMGDRDSDGHDEMAIGADGTVFIFEGPFEIGGEVFWNASSERYSSPVGTGFGASLGAMELDDDGVMDLVVGAPGSRAFHLLPSSTTEPDWWPDLWDPDQDGVVDFDDGLGQSGDTWGPGMGDDGWDTAPPGIYGGSSQQVRYNPGPLESATGTDRSIERVKELQIELGGGNYGEKPLTPASGAYGIQFEIPEDILDDMTSARLRFKWFATDANGIHTAAEELWVKARFGNADDMEFLGADLDQGSDDTKEIGYAIEYESPGQKVLGGDFFETDVSGAIMGPGTYYLELGGKMNKWKVPREYIVVSFDDISLEIGQRTDPTVVGAVGERGKALAVLDMDQDGVLELAVAEKDGPGVVFYRGQDLRSFASLGSTPEEEGRYDIVTVETHIVLGSIVCPDPSGDLVRTGILVGTPEDQEGSVRLVKRFQAPAVTIVSPVEGEVLSGRVTLSAEVIDIHGNGSSMEATFHCSDGQGGWNLLGTADIGTDNGFSLDWETGTVPNGEYLLKAQVRNLHGSTGEDVLVVSVSNPHPPKGSILSPANGSVLSGEVAVRVRMVDLGLDLESGVLSMAFGQVPPEQGQEGWTTVGVLGPVQGAEMEVEVQVDTRAFDVGGPYWLSLEVIDAEGSSHRTIAGPFTISNPAPPTVTILSPLDDEGVHDGTIIRARIVDPDGDIDPRGARFYYRVDGPAEEWHLIGSDPVPDEEVFSLVWSERNGHIGPPEGPTSWTLVLKVNATDVTGLEGEEHVRVWTVPEIVPGSMMITIHTPVEGDVVSGTVELGANVSGEGTGLVQEVCFQARGVRTWAPWQEMACDVPDEEGGVVIEWDSSTMMDGSYDMRALAFLGGDVLSSRVIQIDIFNDGPTKEGMMVGILWPGQGDVLKGKVVIRLHIEDDGPLMDLSDRIETIEVLYSRDGVTFLDLGVWDAATGTEDGFWDLEWNSTSISNGYIFMMAVVEDRDGAKGSSKVVGPVEVRNSPPRSVSEGPVKVTTSDLEAAFLFGAVLSAFASMAVGLSLDVGRYSVLRYMAVPFLPMYSKLKKERLLDNVLRKRIYKYICENPGDNFTSIKRKIGLTNGVFAYHLWTLEREEMIVSRIDGRYRRFYPMKGVKPPNDIDGLNWFQLGILDTISKNEGLSLKDLAKVLGVSPQVIGYHLKVMSLAGLIRKKRKGKMVEHYAVLDEEDMENIEL